MNEHEHRRAPRIKRQFLVSFRAPEGGAPRWDTVPSRDMSALGVRFLGEQPLKVGAALELEVRLPSSQRLVPMKGEVVWKQPSACGPLWEYGVFFTALDPGAEQQLQETVAFFLTRSSEAA